MSEDQDMRKMAIRAVVFDIGGVLELDAIG